MSVRARIDPEIRSLRFRSRATTSTRPSARRSAVVGITTASVGIKKMTKTKTRRRRVARKRMSSESRSGALPSKWLSPRAAASTVESFC